MALKMLQRGQVCSLSARPAASRAAIPVPGMRTSTIMRYRDGEEVRFGRDGPLQVSPAVQLPAIAPLLLLPSAFLGPHSSMHSQSAKGF
jgi:hypothetical protein